MMFVKERERITKRLIIPIQDGLSITVFPLAGRDITPFNRRNRKNLFNLGLTKAEISVILKT
jgi:hypothetical protein